jgi:hypothetical protein
MLELEISIPAGKLLENKLANGWLVNGIFRVKDEYHGLVYNPHIDYWFHMWWDLNGNCLMGNTSSKFNLSFKE